MLKKISSLILAMIIVGCLSIPVIAAANNADILGKQSEEQTEALVETQASIKPRVFIGVDLFSMSVESVGQYKFVTTERTNKTASGYKNIGVYVTNANTTGGSVGFCYLDSSGTFNNTGSISFPKGNSAVTFSTSASSTKQYGFIRNDNVSGVALNASASFVGM